MPLVHIHVTRDGVTAEQKAELIRGATDLLVRVLDKNPDTTFVLIDEIDTDNWGVAGRTVTSRRLEETALPPQSSQPAAGEA